MNYYDAQLLVDEVKVKFKNKVTSTILLGLYVINKICGTLNLSIHHILLYQQFTNSVN